VNIMLTLKASILAGGVVLACVASAGAGYMTATARLTASVATTCPQAAAQQSGAMPPWGGPATLPQGKSW
jgi:hypothetical protein